MKGKLFIVLVLAMVTIAVFGGKASKDSSSTMSPRSLASVNTEAKGIVSKTTVTLKKTSAPTATPKPSAMPELKSGSKDDEVTVLQELLIQYGYLSGTVSGEYDNATVKAVKDFQINNGLIETGDCDQEVWEKITNRPRRQENVYKSKKGKVYHSRSNCSGMKTATQMTLSDALRKGLTPCSHCY